jgi:Tn3 transposase DDE domain
MEDEPACWRDGFDLLGERLKVYLALFQLCDEADEIGQIAPEPVEPPDNEGAITLWNTVYLERATEQMAKSRQFDPALFQHVSPLGWEHINLTGDYTWHTNKRVAKGAFRPLRSPRNPFSSP